MKRKPKWTTSAVAARLELDREIKTPRDVTICRRALARTRDCAPQCFQDECDAIVEEARWAIDVLDSGKAPFRSEPHDHVGEGGATTAYYQNAKMVGLTSRVRDEFNRTFLVRVDLRDHAVDRALRKAWGKRGAVNENGPNITSR